MFPVTLEFKDETIVTVHPPCYGFLKSGNWSGDEDGYEDEDGDWIDGDNMTYEAEDGSWFMHYRRYSSGGYQSNIVRESRGHDEIHLGGEYDLSDLKYIWNSGTHYPIIGLSSEGEEIAAQFDLGSTDPLYPVNEYRLPIDNVAAWARENNSDLTVKAVMEMFEKVLDKDSDSCLVWHKDGFMGVEADAPADRCLFYLMLNRILHLPHEKDAVAMMLDEIKNGCTPMQALIISRLIVNSIHFMTSIRQAEWTGNDYDSCLLPMSLITTGMGKQFAEPIQVPWRQAAYINSDGHKRDEDYPCLYYSPDNTSVSNSMFIPVLHPDKAGIVNHGTPTTNRVLSGRSLVLDFAKEVSLNAATHGRLVSYGTRHNGAPSTHRFMHVMMYDNPSAEGSGYQMRPRSEWVSIIKDLLLL